MILRIKNLRLVAILGTFDWERETPQALRASVTMDVDAEAAAAEDDLTLSVDYAALSDEITAMVKQTRFFLLEKLAGEILKLALADPRVRWAKVELDKPAALPAAESVSVTTFGRRPPSQGGVE
jgi:FolB domain-containing protein